MTIIFILALLSLAPGLAFARVYDLFRSDSPKGAFCDAIGGACAADVDLANSFFQNPAVLANGKSDWDFDGDISAKSNLEPGLNLGNLGDETESNGGIGYSTGKIGLAASMSWQKDSYDGALTIFDDSGLPLRTQITSTASLQQFNLPLGFLVSPRLSFGITPSLLYHKQELRITGSTEATASNPSSQGFGLKIGSLYRHDEKLRFGTWLQLSSTLYERQRFIAQVEATRINYLEDFALHFPWVWSLGAAFETTRNFIFYLENDLIGATQDGHTLTYDSLSTAGDTADRKLPVKGKSVVAQPHWGMRKLLFNRFTLHFGGYYETSRWEGNSGRLHTSAGISYKIGDWLEVIGGLDVARRFTHVFFTFR